MVSVEWQTVKSWELDQFPWKGTVSPQLPETLHLQRSESDTGDALKIKTFPSNNPEVNTTWSPPPPDGTPKGDHAPYYLEVITDASYVEYKSTFLYNKCA